jgi:predicted helicase
MRWHLMKTFDKIYTMDLHGNSKKKETAPDGSVDQNVFDIMQGVSINLFVKTGKKKENELGKVFHYDLYGKREAKYAFLLENSLKSVPYQEISNKPPMYYFVAPQDLDTEKVYNKGFKLNELFNVNSVGITTARDNFTIHYTKDEVKKTIDTFLSMDDESARVKFELGKDARDWQVNFAKKDLINYFPKKGTFCQISYRAFDNRWTFFTGKSKGFHCMPRTDVMQHFLIGDNVGLAITRRIEVDRDFADIFVFNKIIQHHSLSIKEVNNICPLYLYPETKGQLALDASSSRTPNLNLVIVEAIAIKLGLKFVHEKEKGKTTFSPIDILDYIYATLHSPTYRATYQSFLKIDFPRVPYPTDVETFWQLVELGGKLRQVHLLESEIVENYLTEYPIDGTNRVEKIRAVPANVVKVSNLDDVNNGDLNIYINENQYFANVPNVAWTFYIGGYQPAQKWLKDRKDRILDFDDLMHYQKIICALVETERLMREIDGLN